MAEQDYGAMLDMFKLQARRYGIVNRMVSVPSPSCLGRRNCSPLTKKPSPPKTRLLMICHLINITGHILPVKKIVDMAHRHGVEVMVDGAHAFAHLDLKSAIWAVIIMAAVCTVARKPAGSGHTIRAQGENCQNLANLRRHGFCRRRHPQTQPHGYPPSSDRSGHPGCHSFPRNDWYSAQGGSFALPSNTIGRIRYATHPKILLNTPADPQRSVASSNVGIQGIKPADLAKILMEKYKISPWRSIIRMYTGCG